MEDTNTPEAVDSIGISLDSATDREPVFFPVKPIVVAAILLVIVGGILVFYALVQSNFETALVNDTPNVLLEVTETTESTQTTKSEEL